LSDSEVSPWQTLFSEELREAVRGLNQYYFFEKHAALVDARRALESGKLESPYGRENVWAAGLGFKGYPADTLSRTQDLLNLTLTSPLHTYAFRPCVKLLVAKKAPEKYIQPDFLLSKALKAIGKPHVESDVIEVGNLTSASMVDLGVGDWICNASQGAGAGTAGQIVKLARTATDVILSCAHVMVDFSNMNEERIIKVSRGSRYGPEVAKRVDFTGIDFTGRFNVVDAAIAEPKVRLRPSQPPVPNLPFHMSSGCRDPSPFEEVWKQGAASNYTKGGVSMYVPQLPGILIQGNAANFSHVWFVNPKIMTWPPTPSQMFAQVGDSGSVVRSTRTGETVGLLIAVSSTHGYSTICSPRAIASELKVVF
jgi:hypothetical protein